VGKGFGVGGFTNAGAYPGSGSNVSPRCIICKRRIAWNERCEQHKQELRQRRKRKRR